MSEFDPLAILGALERHRVAYVLVGDLAGVLHGTDLTADNVEITPSLKPENTERLSHALDDLGVTVEERGAIETIKAEPTSLSIPTPRGEMTITAIPMGTSGYEDLRRAAQREPLGRGIRVPVTSSPDLIRSLSTTGQGSELERRLRRLIDLHRRLSPEI